MPYLTLTERKRLDAEKLAVAAKAVMAELSDYARTAGMGRFIVFGSAATGAMRYDSDFDVFVDFPPDREAAAWNAVEESCARYGIKPDVLPASMTKPDFLDRIMKSPVKVLP